MLDETGRLPTEAETYEFSIPPLFPLLAVYLERGARRLEAPELVEGTGAVQRLAWLVLVAVGVLLTALGAGRRWRVAGVVLVGAACAWAIAEAAAWAADHPWSAGSMLGLAWGLGTLSMAWLLAREIWPASAYLPVLAVVAGAAIPVSLRVAGMFHPDAQLAFLGALTLWLLIRARRRGWSPWDGIWLEQRSGPRL